MDLVLVSLLALNKTPKFHLISWCGYVERTVSREFRAFYQKLRRKYGFRQNFYTRKLGENLVFYVVRFVVYI